MVCRGGIVQNPGWLRFLLGDPGNAPPITGITFTCSSGSYFKSTIFFVAENPVSFNW
jgi:hypothetical protein